MSMRWKPHVTVAAVIEKNGQFLMVEELIDGQIVINQPAGHLEPGESLTQASIRETLEETAWQFQPEYLLGIYRWQHADQSTFLRFAFTGTNTIHDTSRQLDPAILQALWMDVDTIKSKKTCLRSPMVLLCIQDYLQGKRYPLDLLTSLDT